MLNHPELQCSKIMDRIKIEPTKIKPKPHWLLRLVKNVLLFAGLFMVFSVVMDLYRKPTAPTHFAQQVLYDLDQQPKMIAQLSHSKPLVIYVWGSWCSICHYTSPMIDSLAREGANVLSVALKSGSSNEVKAYLAEKGYVFSTINDPVGQFSREWDIQVTPTILIIKQGKIVHYTTGLTSYWGLKARLWLAD